MAAWLSDWTVERARDWVTLVNWPQPMSELESLRLRVQRGCPFGEDAWVLRMTTRFGMEPRGRSRGC